MIRENQVIGAESLSTKTWPKTVPSPKPYTIPGGARSCANWSTRHDGTDEPSFKSIDSTPAANGARSAGMFARSWNWNPVPGVCQMRRASRPGCKCGQEYFIRRSGYFGRSGCVEAAREKYRRAGGILKPVEFG